MISIKMPVHGINKLFIRLVIQANVTAILRQTQEIPGRTFIRGWKQDNRYFQGTHLEMEKKDGRKFGSKKPHNRGAGVRHGGISALCGFQQSLEFLRAHAVLGESAPLNAGRSDRT